VALCEALNTPHNPRVNERQVIESLCAVDLATLDESPAAEQAPHPVAGPAQAAVE
jgi:hypothetical protein